MRKTKSAKSANVQSVIAFARRYNRVEEKQTVVTVSFEAPKGASVETLLDLAHAQGLSRGDRTTAGVFEIQTAEGIWSHKEGKKLLCRTGVRVHDGTMFRSWEVLEAAELAEVA
jgi:hypothetical protein